MTALYIGLAGTLLFLLLTILSFINKRFRLLVSFWKYPLILLPLIVFVCILATHLYIAYKGNGCSYTDRQDFVMPEKFPVHKKSGILLAFIDGFGDCRVSVTMNNGKTYSTESFNNVFALVLPADSGEVNEILTGGNGDTLFQKINFVINPGKLTYAGSISSPKGIASLLPGMACKAANFSYKTDSDIRRALLGKWAEADRLVVTSVINNRLTELQKNYKAASRISGILFGYVPYISTSLNGQVQNMAPCDVMKEYKEYEFLFRSLIPSTKSTLR